MKKYTEEDIHAVGWTPYVLIYFLDILNRAETSDALDETRSDLESLIGTKYDNRVKKADK